MDTKPDDNKINPITKPDHSQEEPDLEPEPVKTLLEPFKKDQLVLLIKKSVTLHPDLLHSVHTLAESDPAHRKIFVHGLEWETTAETLKLEFSKFGEIENCRHVVDKVSGKSKGYAFILFKKRSGARKALAEPQMKIGNRVASCQLASEGPVSAPPPSAPPVSEYTQRHVVDKVSGKSKGYMFILVKKTVGAKKALAEPQKRIGNRVASCQLASEGPVSAPPPSVPPVSEYTQRHMVDKVRGKSKGYVFILFKKRSGAKKALAEPQKRIGNRVASCQLASEGPVSAAPVPVAPPVSEYTQRKIFVSNVAAEIDPAKLTEYFSQFGEIEEGPLGLDRITGRPKGFCLFVYKSIDSAKKALEERHKMFEGVKLHCYKAVDGPKSSQKGGFQQQNSYQQQQFHPQNAKRFKGGKYPPRGGSMGAPPGQPNMVPPSGMDPAALAPALGQALTTLLAGQGGGLGNLLGGFGAPPSQGVPPNQGYRVQPGGSYGMQGAYQNPQMGQSGGRPPMGGGAPHMGHGY